MAIDQARLEGELQSWVKIALLPLLREGGLSSELLAEQMARELDELSRVDAAGRSYAPDQFTLSIHPEAASGLAGSFSDIHASLSQTLENILVGNGFKLSRRIHVTLATDPTLPVGEGQVIAWHSGDPLKVTKELSPERRTEAGEPPADAFLMVAGKRHFPLDKPEVSIGRLLQNELVLKDIHVSRRHALVRLEGGRYVIYDLKSTSGTKVNGTLVQAKPLQPGDVITLATTEIVYGEGPGKPPTETLPYQPPSTEEQLEQDVTPLDMKRFDYPTLTFRRDRDSDPEDDRPSD